MWAYRSAWRSLNEAEEICESNFVAWDSYRGRFMVVGRIQAGRILAVMIENPALMISAMSFRRVQLVIKNVVCIERNETNRMDEQS